MRLARRRLLGRDGAVAAKHGGYYGAYAYVIYRTVTGALTWGTLQFLAGAIAGTSSNIQSVFSTFSSIADQSLFLTDLVEFLQVRPKIRSKPDAHASAASDSRRLHFRESHVCLSRQPAQCPGAVWISGWSRESASR